MDKLTPEQMCRVAELVTGNKRHEVLNGEVVIYEFLGGRSAHRSNINIIEFNPAFDGTDQQQAQACKVVKRILHGLRFKMIKASGEDYEHWKNKLFDAVEFIDEGNINTLLGLCLELDG